MTTEEKIALTQFLYLAGDYLQDGHRRNRTLPLEIEPDEKPESRLPGFSSLPLAYQVDEDDDETNTPYDSLEKIAEEISACQACALAATRNRTVSGEGADRPQVLVIGEGPGADEDREGRPFVGKAGQLLDKMLASIELSRKENCFIANMVKCRPPGNRDPKPEEIAACFPFLQRQIALLEPQVILCAGRVAAQNLLKTNRGINALRGEFAEFKISANGESAGDETAIPVLPTFHPSALLREESLKRPAWEDLKLLKARLVSMNEQP